MRSAHRVASLVIFATISCLFFRPASAATFASFDDTTMLVNTIASGDGQKILYSQQIVVHPNDVLQTFNEFEVTNDTGTTVRIWAELVLSTNPNGTTGTVIAEPNEKSITPGMHHCTRIKGGMSTITGLFTQPTQTKYLNLVIWSDGDLTVEAGKGHLQGMVITAGAGSTFSTYDSGHDGELLTTLPGDDTYRPLYSVNVGTLVSGDFLIVFSEAQLETMGTLTDTERLSAKLLRVNTTGAATGLDQPNAFQVASDDPIGTPVKVATVAIGAGTTDRNIVQLDLRATTDLTVMQGYGRLEVLKIHPGT
jgi:hypothetical protein